MSLPEPFAYPAEAHIRKYAPSGYKDYTDYKPWLRDEFSFRCVYCLHRETWSRGGAANFSVEHIIPQSHDAAGVYVCDYSNLLYACTACNTARKALDVLDPTEEGLGSHLGVQPDGTVAPFTYEGLRLVRILKLNREDAVRERGRLFRILARRARYPDEPDVRRDYCESFGHPEDLPDLRRIPPHGPNPPGGNVLEANTANCYFALRERGCLPLILHVPSPVGCSR